MTYSYLGGEPRESFKNLEDKFKSIESFMGYYLILIYQWQETQNYMILFQL